MNRVMEGGGGRLKERRYLLKRSVKLELSLTGPIRYVIQQELGHPERTSSSELPENLFLYIYVYR